MDSTGNLKPTKDVNLNKGEILASFSFNSAHKFMHKLYYLGKEKTRNHYFKHPNFGDFLVSDSSIYV